jgi:putative ABC transport system permease protein
MVTLLQDLRYAFRSFRKSPGFTFTALLTVALGVGANTAIFSVVNGVLLRPLPLGQPERVMLVGHRYTKIHLETGVSAIGFRFYHDQNQVFEKSAGFTGWEANLARAGGGEPERLLGQRVTSEYFAALGIRPTIGRAFTADEEQEGADKVVILSDALWAREFGRDRGILNKTIVVNGEAHAVVGVARNGFRFGTEETAIWKPLVFTPDQRSGCWGCEFMGMVARLKPGVTAAAVNGDLDRITRLVRAIPGSYRDDNWLLYSKSATEQVTGTVRPALLVLMGAVGFVLLIACANLANLLLARATARQREIAIRTAMGAGRGRLARQLLTESILLASIGGAAGLVLAWGAVRGLVASNPVNLPRIDAVGIDGRVLAFTAGITVLLGFLFGLAPAIQAARPALTGMLKDGMRASHRGGLRAALVVSEVSLAIVLLIGAGLMLKSFRHWVAVEPGFRSERVLTFGVSLPNASYGKKEQQIAFFDQLRRGISALPGVQAVGGNIALPMTNSNWTRSFQVEGYQPPANTEGPWGDFRVVTPGYFETMGIPLKRGRTFDETDLAGGRRVAVVDEVLAKKYWPGQDPIGKRVGFQQSRDSTAWLEIVGVVGHVMQNSPRDDEHTQLYQPFAQAPFTQMGLAMRTGADPLALVPQIRRLVLSIDPAQPIFDVKPMEERVSGSAAQPRFLSLLLGLFAGLAATLAAVGIYGVMSYTVAQQTRELGIRLALGAETGNVLRLVLNRGLALAGLGVGIGVAGAYALARVVASALLEKTLYQTSAVDPVIFSTVAAGLVAVAFAATWIPARRATRVDPVVALRAE